MQRFWSKVKIEGPDDCWEWLAAKDGGGYGIFYLDGKTVGAHRVAYTLANGRIKDGLHILHSCNNSSCMNPKHLREDTHSENMSDAIANGITGNARGKAKLYEEDLEEIRTLYDTGNYTHRELAAMFKVSDATICRQLQGKYSNKGRKEG